jgi:hypothetical protein
MRKREKDKELKKEKAKNLFPLLSLQEVSAIIKGHNIFFVEKVENKKIDEIHFFTGLFDDEKNEPLLYSGYITYFCPSCGLKYKQSGKSFKNHRHISGKCQKCSTMENTSKEEFIEKQRNISKKRWKDGCYEHLKESQAKWGKENCKNILKKTAEEKKEINIKKVKTWFRRNLEERKRINKTRCSKPQQYTTIFKLYDRTILYGGFEWKSISSKKRSESENTCYICGKTDIRRRLAVHHIVPYRICKNHDNLIVLCMSCHRVIEAKTIKYINENKNISEEQIKKYAEEIICESKKEN